MDRPINSADQGNSMFILSFLMGFLGISPTDLEYGFKMLVLIISAIAGIFAARYHILAAREKKQAIQLNEEKLNVIEFEKEKTKQNGQLHSERTEEVSS